MNEIIIQYIFTVEEATMASIEVTKSVQRWSGGVPIIGVFLLLVSALSLFFLDGQISTLLPAVAMGLVFTALPLLVRRSIRKRAAKNPSTGNTVRWTIDDSLLTNSTEGAESKFVWEKLIKVEERKKGFLLFPQPRVAHWLPKHGFASEADMERFRQIAKSKNLVYKG